jgi:hypothetical protein
MEDYFFYLVFAGIFVFVLYSLFTKHGKGRMLGGTITETLPDEIVQKKGMVTTTVRVHVVDSNQPEKLVGVEISESAKLGASFKPISLSKSDALKLAGMLNEAASKT